MTEYQRWTQQENGKAHETVNPTVRVGSNNAAGLYIEAAVNINELKMLISKEAYEGIEEICRPKLRKVHQVILVAQGTPLEVSGIAYCNINTAGLKFPIKAIVANIGIGEIIGLDFLRQYGGIVKAKNH